MNRNFRFAIAALTLIIWSPVVQGRVCLFVSRLTAMDYPLLGVQSRTQGVVKLELKLDEHLAVKDVRVLSGAKLLARAAVVNARTWHFLDCAAEDQDQVKTVELEYRFVLSGTALKPKGSFTYEHPFIVTIESQAQQAMP